MQKEIPLFKIMLVIFGLAVGLAAFALPVVSSVPQGRARLSARSVISFTQISGTNGAGRYAGLSPRTRP